MQKRTRIFAAITVSIGLLLGLGMFLATFADVGAMGFKHHGGRHVVVKNGTTVTSTITSTVTNTDPPSPGVCFPTPNSGSTPAFSVDGVGGTIASHALIELHCSGLNSWLTYEIFFSTPCSVLTVLNSASATATVPVAPGLTPGEFETVAIAPDNAGNLNLILLLGNCVPGTVFIHFIS